MRSIDCFIFEFVSINKTTTKTQTLNCDLVYWCYKSGGESEELGRSKNMYFSYGKKK